MNRDKESISKMIRAADCTGCDYADTVDGDGCYMFIDRDVCYTKRSKEAREAFGQSLRIMGRQ